jgi:primosomal protein N' (replication factor Y)
MGILRVALDVPLPKLFDYACASATAADVGRRVLVPFGPRRVVGIVVDVCSETSITPEKLRPAGPLLDDMAPLTAAWLALARFAAEYYQRPLGEVIHAALPPRLRQARPLTRTPRRIEPSAPAEIVADYALTPPQAKAVAAVSSALDRYAPFLLCGVTGSGKTEVYLHCASRALTRGRQALVLVPEINLTPQLATDFSRRFAGARVVTLTSALAANERAHAWLAAQSGAADIVLGTRLAVFAPLPRLGLVVVDEEQDASFKQQDGVRYSARDLAVYRARAANVPVVLGSATPSLESWSHAVAGRYRLLELPERARAGSLLPSIRLVDTRGERAPDGVSDSLAAAIEARLARGEQSLIFLNRRGYAPVLVCGACGWTSGCPRCSAHLVLHTADRRLRCHHCGHEARIPRHCPHCGNVDLAPFGRGTQRLEEVLAKKFPHARLLRVDSDSTRAKGRWEGMREAITAGDADLLIGTQILAKGHDFQRVSLVGILNCDAALAAADYRASERLFAQLFQVAGRAGRAETPGEVLVQTRYPRHPLYQAFVRHAFAPFAATLLAERRDAGFPPYVHEAALRAESDAMPRSIGFLASALAAAPAARDRITLYDPVPMSLARRAGRERAHVVVQSPSRRALQRFLAQWTAVLYGLKQTKVRWHLDVDPIEF